MRMRRFLEIVLLVSVVTILRQTALMHTAAMMDAEFIPPTQFFSLPSETAAGNKHGIEIEGRGEEEGDPSVCKMRDLSEYTKHEATGGQKLSPSRTKKLKNAKCLSFRCNKNVAPCDNGLPTNYDGPEPPCCTHILRDMARIFDDTMCGLGLEYISTFGTLLGLVRSDRFIPWTSDIDYIIPSKYVANAMVDLWDTRTTGMAHHFEKGLNRICVTGDFAGGELKEKWEDERPLLNWSDENAGPYMDFYIGRNVTDQTYKPLPECEHLYRDVFPTKRVYVYNRTFATNMPANPDQLLRTMYGRNWRKPRANKSVHGGGPPCPYSPTLSL